jgi:ATP/maltotriose-dependent transcriptional regulator MalT
MGEHVRQPSRIVGRRLVRSCSCGEPWPCPITTREAEITRLREHIDTDHGVMVNLGQIADAAVQMLEHVNMDTDEDRELHARAVAALRGRLDEIAAAMKEANEAAHEVPADGDFDGPVI